MGWDLVSDNRANNQSIGQKTSLSAGQEEQRAGVGFMPAETGSVHPGIYDDAQEAEFGPAKSSAGPVDERLRGDQLHWW